MVSTPILLSFQLQALQVVHFLFSKIDITVSTPFHTLKTNIIKSYLSVVPQYPRRMSSLQPNSPERPTPGISQSAEALPRLPRGWSRVCHETGMFLRSIGLGIVVTAFQGFFTQGFLVPEKVAIRRSRITAHLRAMIHSLPVGVAIFEICFNWKGHYVGYHFDKQNYLRFAAKAHEATMQAPIATILLTCIRHESTASSGMPFGAVLGGLQFIQLS